MTIEAITINDMLKAIRFDDQDKAISYLQIIAGIDGSEVAEKSLAGFDWQSSDLAQRLDRLFIWVKAERAHAESGGAPFNLEHYASLDFLMQSLEELGFSAHLPMVMNNARRAMTALREAHPICAAYDARKQKIARLG